MLSFLRSFVWLNLDTSATANVWFNSDFILLSEFNYTYLHQASKHQQQNPCKKQNWTPSVRRYPHWHLFSPVSFFPVTHTFILFLFFLSCFYFFYTFVPVTFLPVIFFHHTVTFFPVTFFPVIFNWGKIVTSFPVSLSPPRLLPFFLLLFFLLLFFLPKTVTFFPVTFFPVTFFPSTLSDMADFPSFSPPASESTIEYRTSPLAGPYEAKAQSCSWVHKVNCDYPSLVI